MSKLDTAPYKGVRDFYPEDQFIQNYVFGVWKKAAESFGYSEFNASILESSEIYKEKSGEEIINEQTYTFIDRGEREVTLRPEMTPTIARMIAARKRELGFPLRWYSIPNIFRYEAPQRGRLREHWQLNIDVFGVDSLEADIEVIEVANKIMQDFGASEKDFVIKLNDYSAEKRLDEAKKMLGGRNINNVEIDLNLTRGQAYYTGMVFEVFDSNPENKRSLFGGGRYDNLTEMFGGEKISAVGFGAGDVTIRDFLRTHGLLPEYKNSATLALLPLEKKYFEAAEKIANELRRRKVNTFVDWSDRKIGDKIKNADKQKILFIAAIGEDEIKSNKFKLKNLKTGEEKEVALDKIPECVK